MRVIITGGTGLIGRALGADLAGDGHEVIALSRNPARVRGLPAGMRAERWDGRTAAGWGALAEGAGAIVNLAGENLFGLWTAGRRVRIRRSRLEAGHAVVQAVAEAREKPKVLIQASAVGYYGPRGDEVVTEDTPPGSDFLASVCRDWEAATAAVEAHGVRRVVTRWGVVLSRKGGILPVWALPYRLFVGGRLASGRQWVPWLHVRDEVDAIRFLIENEAARGPFNLSSPEPATNAQFSRALARALRRPNLMWVPSFALRLVLGDLSILVLGSQRVLPTRLQALGYQFRCPNLDRALDDLLR
jgi:uncharacterized protein (TIGR01777 family)